MVLLYYNSGHDTCQDTISKSTNTGKMIASSLILKTRKRKCNTITLWIVCVTLYGSLEPLEAFISSPILGKIKSVLPLRGLNYGRSREKHELRLLPFARGDVAGVNSPDVDRNVSLKMSQERRRQPIPVSEEMGASVFGFFDPLSVASDENFARNRERELKHGRVAMLASVGMVVPDFFRFPGYLSESFQIKFSDLPSGIGAVRDVPILGWVQIVVLIGILERFVFVQRGRGEMPGDYGTGYFGKVDKSAHEAELLIELDAGRLAMIAVVGQVSSELVTGYTPVGQWRSGLILGDFFDTLKSLLQF